MTFELTSSAISANHDLPTRFTCDGAHISPPLTWSGAPQNTASFVLIVDDPDAPHDIFTHWVLFNIPGDVDYLDENIQPEPQLANGARQGRNDFGRAGYGAPCPPRGESHRYRFTLYALDAPLRLPASATRQQALQAMQAHALDQAQLISVYRRRSWAVRKVRPLLLMNSCGSGQLPLFAVFKRRKRGPGESLRSKPRIPR